MTGKLQIRTIAEQTGLSISTVSRVLAGKANTSRQAKQRVLACARSQGILTNLSNGRLFCNHMIVFAPARAFDVRADIFYFRMIQGIRAAVAPYDVHLSFGCLEEHGSDSRSFVKSLTDKRSEAAIIIGVDDPVVHEIAADVGKPCVLVNACDRSMRLDSVLPDHRQIGEFSASHLIRHGHRRILFVVCLRRFTLESRLQGVKDGFALHNLPFDPERQLVVTAGFGAREAELAVDAWLEARTPDDYPTAVLASGDFLALGVMNALARRNLSVPGDVSVMSMDAFNLASIHDIALTAVHVPREELGQEALGLLQRRMLRPDALASNVLVGARLVPGASIKRVGAYRAKAIPAEPCGGLYGN
jgi:DNA-binding LacI/PurR family transcriptional regulator